MSYVILKVCYTRKADLKRIADFVRSLSRKCGLRPPIHIRAWEDRDPSGNRFNIIDARLYLKDSIGDISEDKGLYFIYEPDVDFLSHPRLFGEASTRIFSDFISVGEPPDTTVLYFDRGRHQRPLKFIKKDILKNGIGRVTDDI